MTSTLLALNVLSGIMVAPIIAGVAGAVTEDTCDEDEILKSTERCPPEPDHTSEPAMVADSPYQPGFSEQCFAAQRRSVDTIQMGMGGRSSNLRGESTDGVV
jgi:hypothetical protein